MGGAAIKDLVEHPVAVSGRGFEGIRYYPEAHAFFFKHLAQNLRDATRARIFSVSRQVGRPIKGLSEAWDLRVEDAGSSEDNSGHRFRVFVPTLEDAAPELFAQRSLFDDELRGSDTVFDLLGDVIRDVRASRRSSPLFDSHSLREIQRLERAPESGINEARIESTRYAESGIELNPEVGRAAEALLDQTPDPARTRVMGKLDAVFFDGRALALSLADGSRLRGAWASDDIEPLRELWGRDVLIEGRVQFRPDGTALGIEAEAIRIAGPSDSIWSKLPKGKKSLKSWKTQPLSPAERNPLDLIVGQYPGDETDDEFLALLEGMS